jgi:hypothetical protein
MVITEIEQRKPVWSALSKFYLDTEVSEEEITRIAKVFRTSRYSIEELKEINYSEVAPVVYTNLLSTAGVWEGCDEEWLYEQIAKEQLKGKGMIAKLFRPFYREQTDKACKDIWQAVEREMINLPEL